MAISTIWELTYHLCYCIICYFFVNPLRLGLTCSEIHLLCYITVAQFWNIPVTISPYNGTYAGIPVSAEDGIYKVKVEYPLSEPRIFIAEWSHLRWDNKRKPCLYGGDSMGGPIFEAPGYDSVIEGKATDYIVDDLFSTDFRFEQYDGICLDSTPISDSA